MVKHLRIDNRLIHGQVATVWTSFIGASVLIVANNKVAVDPIQKFALPMAARGVDTKVFTLDETLEYMKKNPDKSVFLICKFATDALELLEKGLEVEKINVGNQAPLPATDYKMVTKSIAVTKEDAITYRKIAELKGGLTSQMLPSSSVEDFIKLLEQHGL